MFQFCYTLLCILRAASIQLSVQFLFHKKNNFIKVGNLVNTQAQSNQNPHCYDPPHFQWFGNPNQTPQNCITEGRIIALRWVILYRFSGYKYLRQRLWLSNFHVPRNVVNKCARSYITFLQSVLKQYRGKCGKKECKL